MNTTESTSNCGVVLCAGDLACAGRRIASGRISSMLDGCPAGNDDRGKAAGAGKVGIVFTEYRPTKKIMSYFARGFAEQGLRCTFGFAGHGRTPGHFLLRARSSAVKPLLREFLREG